MQPSSLLEWYYHQGHTIAGLDEAGRGPLAGPVVAAAVVLDPTKAPDELADSKKLSEKKREELHAVICERAIAVGIAVVSSNRIDEINILRASLEAMKLAFRDAEKKSGICFVGALVDGNQRTPLDPKVKQYTIVDGDAILPPIMAASIIAKVHRDRLMRDLALQYPGYGFEKHKGYATRDHFLALKSLGPCDVHRRSFAPVAEFFNKTLL